MTTTAFTLDGFKVTRNLGVVRGITVRSLSIVGTLGGSLQTLLGGNISLFTSLCEKARAEAFDLMITHAHELGAKCSSGCQIRRHRVDVRGDRGLMLWDCDHRGESLAERM